MQHVAHDSLSTWEKQVHTTLPSLVRFQLCVGVVQCMNVRGNDLVLDSFWSTIYRLTLGYYFWRIIFGEPLSSTEIAVPSTIDFLHLLHLLHLGAINWQGLGWHLTPSRAGIDPPTLLQDILSRCSASCFAQSGAPTGSSRRSIPWIWDWLWIVEGFGSSHDLTKCIWRHRSAHNITFDSLRI